MPGHPYEQGFDLRLVPEKLSDPPEVAEAAQDIRKFDQRCVAFVENRPNRDLYPSVSRGVGPARTGSAATKTGRGGYFNAERSLASATPSNFWMQGGSIELGTNTWHGLGLAANISGTHTGAIGTTTIPLSLVTATFGPRYRVARGSPCFDLL